MGARGKTAVHPTEVQRTVTDLTPPALLTGEALAFWHRNSSVVKGIEDIDTFTLLCGLWVDCHTLDGRQKQDAVRQYTSLARQFGMTPDSRRRIQASTADRHSEKKELDF